ncbi:MAG: transketolase [Spirochaetaceae bacterium]|jgi:transketolase|nr:transketolase [Spirochaetaceae bacterium]
MPITSEEITSLKKTAKELRTTMMDIVLWSGGAHIGGSFSCTEILTILYFKYLNINPKEPQWADRDRFVLSKGHAATGYIPTLQKKGFFPYDELKSFNHFGSPFAMHPDSNKVVGCDVSAGSLGHGLAMSAGLGIGARYQKKGWKTVCLMGDGECSEGSVWEAAMTVAHKKVNNVISIVDRNKLMIDGNTEDIVGLEPFADKWRAFGFDVHEVDGHNYRQLSEALDAGWAAAGSDGQPKEGAKPVLILANTVKGKGVDFMEGNVKWHYGSADSTTVAQAKESIEKSDIGGN